MAEYTFTTANFKNEVLNADIPVLVDFWATWCGPCRMVAPIIEELSEQYDGRIKVGKVDVDEESALAAQFGITSIPTVILIKDGKAVETIIGYRPKDAYEQAIEAHL